MDKTTFQNGKVCPPLTQDFKTLIIFVYNIYKWNQIQTNPSTLIHSSCPSTWVILSSQPQKKYTSTTRAQSTDNNLKKIKNIYLQSTNKKNNHKINFQMLENGKNQNKVVLTKTWPLSRNKQIRSSHKLGGAKKKNHNLKKLSLIRVLSLIRKMAMEKKEKSRIKLKKKKSLRLRKKRKKSPPLRKNRNSRKKNLRNLKSRRKKSNKRRKRKKKEKRSLSLKQSPLYR